MADEVAAADAELVAQPAFELLARDVVLLQLLDRVPAESGEGARVERPGPLVQDAEEDDPEADGIGDRVDDLVKDLVEGESELIEVAISRTFFSRAACLRLVMSWFR